MERVSELFSHMRGFHINSYWLLSEMMDTKMIVAIALHVPSVGLHKCETTLHKAKIT